MAKNTTNTGNRKCWMVIRAGFTLGSRLTLSQAKKLRSESPDSQYVREGFELIACDGEAHSNPHINNCSKCAPRWGWIMVPEGTNCPHPECGAECAL